MMSNREINRALMMKLGKERPHDYSPPDFFTYMWWDIVIINHLTEKLGAEFSLEKVGCKWIARFIFGDSNCPHGGAYDPKAKCGYSEFEEESPLVEHAIALAAAKALGIDIEAGS